MRLTEAQQKLVEEHAHIAESLARRICPRVDSALKLSAAYYGLCLAATKPVKPGTFHALAKFAIRRAIYSDMRQWYSRSKYVRKVEMPCDQWDGIATSDHVPTCDSRLDAQHFMGRFDRLSPSQRDTIERYMAGESLRGIATADNRSHQTVHKCKQSAVDKLLVRA